MNENREKGTEIYQPWKKALSVLLSVIIAFGAFINIVFGSQNKFKVNSTYSAYAAEFDETPPTKPIVTKSNESLTNDSVKLTAKSSDSETGIAAYSFSPTPGAYCWSKSATKTFYNNTTVYVYSKDNSGNISQVSDVVEITNIDKSGPSYTNVTTSHSEPIGENITITVNGAIDIGAGLADKAYSFSNEAETYNWQEESSKTITENQTVYIYVRDALGNVTYIGRVEINDINSDVPVIQEININKRFGKLTGYRIKAQDEISDIDSYSFDGGVTWQSSSYISSNFIQSSGSFEVEVKNIEGNVITQLVQNYPDILYNNLYTAIYNSENTLDGNIEYRTTSEEWYEYNGQFLSPNRAVRARLVNSNVIVGEHCYKHSEIESIIGTYTESNIDFTLSYNSLEFDFIRSYDSYDGYIKYSTDSYIKKNDRGAISVLLPDLRSLTFIKENETTYTNKSHNAFLYFVYDNAKINEYILEIDDVFYHYNSDGVITSISNKYDDVITIKRNDSEIIVEDNTGRAYTLLCENPKSEYRTEPLITTVIDPAGGVINYTYDEYDNLLKVVDQAGVTISNYSYSIGEKPLLTKNGYENITYNSNFTVAKIKNDSGAYVKYKYDDDFTVNAEYPDTTTTKEKYNSLKLLTSITDEKGNVTEYTYDDYLRLASEKCGNDVTTYTYDDNGNLIKTVDNSGNETVYTYNDDGKLLREKESDCITYYEYENDENVLTATLKEDYDGEIPDLYDPSLTCFDVVRYTYDNGMLVKSVDSQNTQTIKYVYDDYGNTVKTTIEELNPETAATAFFVTDCTYDIFDNVLTIKSGEEITSYIYDAAGRTLLVNDNGEYTRTLYDEHGRIVQEIAAQDYDIYKDGLPESNTYADSTAGQTYKYAENGTLSSEKNRLDVTTNYFYNSVGSKIREEFDIYKYFYGDNGYIDHIEVSGVTTVSYKYNYKDNLVSVEYANGDSIRYEYNNNNQVVKQYKNDSSTPYVTYAYKNNGELSQKVNCDSGLKTVYGENNKVDVYKTSDDTLVQSYFEEEVEREATLNDFDDYDFGENNETLLLPTRDPVKYTKVTENHFGTSCSSVTGGRGVTHTIGSNKVWYGYSYNTEDKYKKMYEDSVEYNGKKALSSRYTYDEKGNITEKNISNYGAKLVLRNTYDDKSRIASSATGSKVTSYTYDADSQLTAASSDNYSASYAYDSRGNITNKTVNGAETTFTYAESGWKDRLVKVNSNELTYDANGNVLTYAGKTYEWENGRNLKKITDGDNTYSYTYDENGIRTSKTVNGVTTYYNTKDGVILSQTDGTNTMYFQYDINGIPLGFTYNGTQYFYLTNQMGDVVGITDSAGTIVGQYRYDEWGNVSKKTNSDIMNINPIRYRGYYYDTETDYYYLQSRYYDASICRFINADYPVISLVSKNLTNGINSFAYCYNNPVNYKDVTGHLGAEATGTGIMFLLEIIKDLIASMGIVGFGLLLGAGIIAFYLIASIIFSMNGSISQEVELRDTKAKKRKPSKKEYTFCFMNKNGKKKTVGKKMTWSQTITALGITNTTLDYKVKRKINIKGISNNAKSAKGSNEYCWGIYADSKVAAKTLAVALGYNDTPKYVSGGYAHYHDGNHYIHIWYGNKMK